jgi:hypothetical protein
MNEWIELADGTRLNNSYIVKLDEDHLTVHSKDVHGFREAVRIFGDPEKTNRIHSYQFGDEEDWTGFTEPTAILEEDDGVAVSLRKEAD